MTPLALVFMALSWSLVLGLAVWSFRRVLQATERRRCAADADGEPPDG
jgi:hypothetical protein